MPSNRSPSTAPTLIVAALLVAVASPAAAEAPAHDYRFGWEDRTFTAAEESADTPEGETDVVNVTVDGWNRTALRFRLTWQDAHGDPDTLRMVVYDPDGNERARLSDTQSNGTLDAVVRIQETPPGTATVRAQSDDEAWAVFQSKYPASSEGTGTWAVHVTVVDAGDGDSSILLPDRRDPGQAWNLTVQGGAYAGVLLEKTLVEDPDEEPERSPDEVPPPDSDDPDDEDDPLNGTQPDETVREAGPGILASSGAKSLLVALAAAVGMAGAIVLLRRGGS